MQLQAQQFYHRVFVTSFDAFVDTDPSFPPTPGNFNGIIGADYNVTLAAAGAGLIDDWQGVDIVYHAILSTLGNNAIDRLSISGPIYNLHGELVALNKADLWDGTIAHSISYDEFGNQVAGSFARVWTGTFANGTIFGELSQTEDFMITPADHGTLTVLWAQPELQGKRILRGQAFLPRYATQEPDSTALVQRSPVPDHRCWATLIEI